MTNEMGVLFDTMDEGKETLMKDHSVLVDCIYAAMSKGGIEHLFLGDLFVVTT